MARRTGAAHNGRMGLFQQRPEEPSEWAGLPAEPWKPRGPAELLEEPAGSAASVAEIPLFGDIPARTTIAYTAAPDQTKEAWVQPQGAPVDGADDAD